mmetsp:Transcript_30251/g.63785  ORF Transcript_30251/g.63785 Transcript_30251/m.63785 type:complete len:248 (-) Transcript_30251:651-1394(-)
MLWLPAIRKGEQIIGHDPPHILPRALLQHRQRHQHIPLLSTRSQIAQQFQNERPRIPIGRIVLHIVPPSFPPLTIVQSFGNIVPFLVARRPTHALAPRAMFGRGKRSLQRAYGEANEHVHDQFPGDEHVRHAQYGEAEGPARPSVETAGDHGGHDQDEDEAGARVPQVRAQGPIDREAAGDDGSQPRVPIVVRVFLVVVVAVVGGLETVRDRVVILMYHRFHLSFHFLGIVVKAPFLGGDPSIVVNV